MITFYRRQYPPFSRPVFVLPRVMGAISLLAWAAIIVLWMAVWP